MLTRRTAMAALVSATIALSWLSVPALAQAQKLKVVASFSILADLTSQVGGDRIEVSALVGPDGDAHVFSPKPADAKMVADARVVVMNGLGFEGWMNRLVRSSGSKAALVTASTGVKPLRNEEHVHGHGRGHDHAGHSHGEFDPHAWQDVANAKIYVRNIRDGLTKADPGGKEVYEANAKAYLARLDALDAEVKATVGSIPQERRKVITTHDAFGYFARAYGLEFLSPQGVSTDAEASAADVARIVRQIKAERIPAVFLENVSDPRLIERISKESGARIGGRLYSDALSGPQGSAGTYIDMIRSNVTEIAKALVS
ncbi:metal ABC transporter substrate-binding protein [Microvirga makkahensis]|uniref:Zinc ABC transporter solute-binding protein n=1 Tax=Microvirga makkahensis TaxID=1128670 RepID=A0A7X3MVP9_9HYPH|nr:metal ABC transporter substrate-binding protein [Microvirga makkahensis]MXQ14034.1 zinc ABC transporter solute-binding protein [Microvirga makkahensis]